MKKVVLSFALAILGNLAFAQNTSNSTSVDKGYSIEKASTVEEISNVMKGVDATSRDDSNWLNRYYAAFANVQKAKLELLKKSTANVDRYADEALAITAGLKSETNPKVLSEVLVLESIAHAFKFVKAPKDRLETEAKKMREALSQAENIDADNPRILMAKAYLTYLLPDNFGGSKEKGAIIFGEAKAKLASTTAVNGMPSWGMEDANLFITKRP